MVLHRPGADVQPNVCRLRSVAHGVVGQAQLRRRQRQEGVNLQGQVQQVSRIDVHVPYAAELHGRGAIDGVVAARVGAWLARGLRGVRGDGARDLHEAHRGAVDPLPHLPDPGRRRLDESHTAPETCVQEHPRRDGMPDVRRGGPDSELHQALGIHNDRPRCILPLAKKAHAPQGHAGAILEEPRLDDVEVTDRVGRAPCFVLAHHPEAVLLKLESSKAAGAGIEGRKLVPKII
mmetsp:Transcript_88809/g.256154  ORF Transcript_88809/g.256154 Transcript_88809/m.256154 type:complete len:234 (-) Transcript_88809:622-1323(-)